MFVADGGRDIVKDFQDGLDLFDLRKVAGIDALSDLTITRSGDGVLVDFGSGSFLIDDTALNEIGIKDFIFSDNLLV